MYHNLSMVTKKLYILTFLLEFCWNGTVLAQFSGIYITPHDYDSGTISYTNTVNLKYKLKPNNWFKPNMIKVIIGDSIYKFCKDSIFGYRDDENITYRFYKKKEFKILNPREPIILYSIDKLLNGKEYQRVTEYFFSTDSGSPILPLTKMNLKRAYPTQCGFHELIDMYFNNDSELMSYDSYYNVYKINRIYQLNQK